MTGAICGAKKKRYGPPPVSQTERVCLFFSCPISRIGAVGRGLDAVSACRHGQRRSVTVWCHRGGLRPVVTTTFPARWRWDRARGPGGGWLAVPGSMSTCPFVVLARRPLIPPASCSLHIRMQARLGQVSVLCHRDAIYPVPPQGPRRTAVLGTLIL